MPPQVFDRETLERIRSLTPRQAFDETKRLLWSTGATSSEDFREAFESLVEHDILTWEQIEEFEG